MTSGQPRAEIEAGLCQKLALSLRQRKPKRRLPAALTLFNIGRVCAAASMLFLFGALWSSGLGASAHFPAVLPGMTVLLSFLFVPYLLFALVQGARLGLFGLAEFICGLTYLPTNLLCSRGSMHLLGLLYSGLGRFDEALECFRRNENSHHVFEMCMFSPWSERKRLPELLARLGRNEEAWALANHNVEQARRDFFDIDSRPVRENLQCDLIVAALVLGQSGQSDQAAAYLEEACTLGQLTGAPDKNSADQKLANGKSAYQAPNQANLLSLFARGLLNIQSQAYQEAIDVLEQCGKAILEGRAADRAKTGPPNSELLSYCQTLLGQCYLKCGQTDKLESAVALLAQENRSEPPTSPEKVKLNLLQADLKMSQGKGSEALSILESTLVELLNSDAQYDRLLVETGEKYKETLECCGSHDQARHIKEEIDCIGSDHLTSLQKAREQSKTPLLLPQAAARLPHLGATKNVANRSLIFFLAVLTCAAFRTVSHSSNLEVTGWIMISALALIVCARSVFYQVRLRKANFFAAQALARGQAVDVVLKPEGQVLPGVALRNCLVAEGPADVVGRKLEIGISNNLIYASQSCYEAPNSNLKARLYRCQTSGKVLAVETLGRVLTVTRERPGTAAIAPEADTKQF